MVEQTHNLKEFTSYLEVSKESMVDEGDLAWIQAVIESAGRSVSLSQLLTQFPSRHGYGTRNESSKVFNVMLVFASELQSELQR